MLTQVLRRNLSAIVVMLTVGAALFGGAGARHAYADTTTTREVSVEGVGLVSATPDVVIVQLGVAVDAASVAEARKQAADAANTVISAIKADGVADPDIKTVQIDIGPRYDTVNNRQVLRGYHADNVLQVKIRAVDNAGHVIDDATAAGGDAVVVRSINFTIEDTTAVAHQARLQAITDAKTKADDYAGAAGAAVGQVISIHEETSVAPQPVAFAPQAAALAAPSSPTPIQAGTLQVRVQVTVVYALQ